MQIPDLRVPALGLAAWLGGLAGCLLSGWWCLAILALAAGIVLVLRRWVDALTLLAWLLVAVAVGTSALLRQAGLDASPARHLADGHATVVATATVSGDPRVHPGSFGDLVLVDATLTTLQGRGARHHVDVPVLVIADAPEEAITGAGREPTWEQVPLGATVRFRARAQPPDGDRLAAVLFASSPPRLLQPPSPAWQGAARVRAALRASVSHLDPEPRALVPALVVGDDRSLPEELAAEFRTTGLTHLLAVSGTNLTLVVGFLLIVARWVRVRGRWLLLVAVVGIAGFVLLARTEPSVVRAATMGTVALIGLGSNGRQRGVRALGVAVVGLLLLDPAMAVTIGFALSVLATAGILLLAPGWRDALGRWMPRWAAEAISVPAAAQLACTPVVAAISGQVSIVAVVANMLVAPAVGPATVAGLVGGLVGLAWPAGGRIAGTVAGWSVDWIITVADWGAGLPTAAIGWAARPLPLLFLTLLCLALAAVAPTLLARRTTGIGCLVAMVAVVLLPVPTPGWPPDGWVLAACDVGQGDALVLHAGPATAVVVDTGPDPEALGDCLARLEIERVPLLVLTHFHADHVGGMAAVLPLMHGGRIAVSPLAEPAEAAARVRRAAAAEGARLWTPAPGATRRIGEVTWQRLGPRPGVPTSTEDSARSNNASLVLLVDVAGIRMLLTGDIEPPAQSRLADALGDGLGEGLEVDVLKVPHHGSANQDLDFLLGLDAEVALVPVGEENDYGHPDPGLLQALTGAGTRVWRTDRDGDVVVVADDGLQVTARD